MSDNLSTFQPLAGVRGGKLRGPFSVKSVSAFMRQLRDFRIVSDAGDHGSVTVWRDDAGKYHCHFCRWRADIDAQIFSSKAEVKRWLSVWHPKQYEAAE